MVFQFWRLKVLTPGTGMAELPLRPEDGPPHLLPASEGVPAIFDVPWLAAT